jgi:L-alanine-DL-glutamate epimerase-like enolase superfamily enzyme
MKIHCIPLETPLNLEFRISRESMVNYKGLIIIAEHDGITGTGEGVPSSYYGHTLKDVLEECTCIDHKKIHSLEDLKIIKTELTPLKTSIDLLYHDLKGKEDKKPLFKLLNLSHEKKESSITIPLTESSHIPEILDESGISIIKLKLGEGVKKDLERLKAIREHTDCPVRVDANEGWTRNEATQMLKLLERHEVELVEQPLQKDDISGLRKLRSLTDIPIFIDEPIVFPEDVEKYADACDGVVVKVMKHGGVTPTLKCIKRAKELEKKVMIGCFLETSLGITAASHLLSLVDFVDLDGNLFLENDPFTGARITGGSIEPPLKPGIGVDFSPSFTFF